MPEQEPAPEPEPLSAPEQQPPATREVDRAALLGTALAAVVALTFGGEGEWDLLATAAGVALLTVLAAFFRLPAGPRRYRPELAAVSVVASLAATLVIAAPMQALLSRSPDGQRCAVSGAVAAGVVLTDDGRRRAAAAAVGLLAAAGTPTTVDDALAQAADEERRTVLGICLGALTSRWLWLPAAGFALLTYAVADLLTTRVRRRNGRGHAA